MKRPFSLFLLLVFVCFSMIVQAQVIKNYDAEWRKVDELYKKKNLPASALAEVKKIYAKAKTEKQDAQVVKALVYMVMLQDQTRESNTKQAIRDLEGEIGTAKEPAASIIRSLVADLYWRYLQENRWQLYNRSNTVGFAKEDIATWTMEDLHRQIGNYYLASIRNDRLLKQTTLKPFEAIIEKGNFRELRPTLYDLLAHKALNYFRNDERDIKKPAYAFELSQPQAFLPAPQFIHFKFVTRDTSSLHYKALLIYQDLLGFHLENKRTDALIEADIDRVVFVYSRSTAPEKEELYRNALQEIAARYPGNPFAAQASFLLASWYVQRADRYNPLGDTAHRYARLRAREILVKVAADSVVFGKAKNTSEGWVNSMNLLQEISQEFFEFQVEKVNLPAKPFRALVRYKNFAQLHLRVVKKTDALDEALNKDPENYWEKLASAQAVVSWSQALPDTKDMQLHAVEIKVDGLPAGEYYLLASSKPQFNRASASLGVQNFYVSNISYVHQANRYFVLHRESGQPLVNAAVEVFTNEYNYSTYKYVKKKLATYQADKNGYFEFAGASSERYQGHFLSITHNGETLSMDEDMHYYYRPGKRNEQREEALPRIFFFTDRSLYRPGQTVHFKGIAIRGEGKQNSILENYSTTIYLRDVNYQLVDSLKLTTNEFGSFSGKFQLPLNVLNGLFHIVEKGRNTIDISVEEYKRPKFYVEFDSLSRPYRAGDVVTVSGMAKAYAGNNIDGAAVSYRVVRVPRFLYPWRMSRWWQPQGEPMEIAHGLAETDAAGKFSISFTAIPDRTIDSLLDPVFDYRVYADVTDINGETRSAEKLVSAGYRSFSIQISLPDRLPADSLLNVHARIFNLNGESVFLPIKISLRELVPVDRLVRERYWQQPDQFVMSKEEFLRYFPLDEYRNESDPSGWEKKEVSWSAEGRFGGSVVIPGPSEKLKPGWYEIELSAVDKDGKVVKDIRRIEVFDPASRRPATPRYLFVHKERDSYEPGETAKVEVGSAATNVYLIHEVELGAGERKRSFTNLNNEKIHKTYPVNEEDRGGFGLDYFFVKDNRFFQHSDIIQVPWSNKELDIEYSTFRDKTLPGSEEKWTVRIKGYKGEKMAAEMLASMYDASLDQFRPHAWSKPGIWPTFNRLFTWTKGENFSAGQSQSIQPPSLYRSFEKRFDVLLGFSPQSDGLMVRRRLEGNMAGIAVETAAAPSDGVRLRGMPKAAGNVMDMANQESAQTDTTSATPQSPAIDHAAVQVRKNFNETAFFFPDLRTDAEGNIEFSFTAPEALTAWKLQTLAHTRELAFGLNQKQVITQKELMVVPNAPRFLRQGDRMEFSVKVVNLSDKELTGQAELQLLDPTTNVSVDGWMQNVFPNQYFTVAAGATEVVKFPIEVPYQYTSGLTWRVIARAGNLSDGEESLLPVLTNKVLVTETLPLPVRGTGTKTFSFDKLLNMQSETAVNHALTVEYTSNPAWLAVQALPYLMEYPYDCAEQNWNRYYANALATKIANSAPRIKAIFDKWTLDAKNDSGKALLSNLQKNQELKSALLEETPWVLDAKNEEQQKKNLGVLFDMMRMSRELQSSMEKLKQMQSPNGGFVWFKGGPDDRFITQYIVTGIGHLKKLDAFSSQQEDEIRSILKTAIPYLDRKLEEDYKQLLKRKARLNEQQISSLQVQYLYMRSFFKDVIVLRSAETAYNYYMKQAAQFWMKQNKQMQAMTALALNRHGVKNTAADILRSLKETSVVSEEMGRYWIENQFGKSWYWYHAPIETQALVIEAFSEIANDTRTVDDLKTWLIKNKQTNNWRTTKATAEACYALLLRGTDWLASEATVRIGLGNTVISSTDQTTEAGTGYFKKRFEGNFVKPEMGKVSVTVASAAPVNVSWGAVYWQYFEDMDKVTSAATPLRLDKKLFIEKNTDRGPVLTPVNEGTTMKVGDKIKVRIELRVDRDMEYVHMKDMRASALEPVNVLSGYKWQGGLDYYESTRDASTNFFFHYLRKGTYVFEYPLFVTHTGNYSNGITTIQCMYAPEFSAHSEGVRITVE